MSDMTGGSLAHGSSALDSNAVFNLHDEKDVVTLLRRIHQAPLSADDKNELRDAVFSFRNNSKLVDINSLKALFSGQGFAIDIKPSISKTPVVGAKLPEETLKENRLGSTRPSPSFAPNNVTSGLNKPKDTVTQSVSSTKDDNIVSEASKISPQPALDPVKIEVVHAVPSEPETNNTVDEASVVSASSVNAPERIKEIKKAVNLLVGNPVNLIDVNNEVGREYMNSLLDAMKKNNGGSASEVESAMERLEIAFVSVKETVESNKGMIPSKQDASSPPAESEVSTPSAVTEKEISSPEPNKIVHDIKEKTPPSTPAPVSGFASVHQTHLESQKPAPVPEVSVPKIESIPKEPELVVNKVEEPPVAMPMKTPAPTNATGGIMSVAKEKQIQDLITSKKQEAAVTDQQKETIRIASLDPLMTPEVTSGLQQLLSEWALFKSSGIFGTGGSGMEHPLYKQLSNLNMTAVVAGRFEGASPQVKRSITDYMNGWRYEEGIMQEQGELFEHYLRRVVKHILDKRPAVPKE